MDKDKADSQLQVKLMLLGDQAVGKSSLMIRYTEDIFNLNIMGTAGIDLKKKNVTINNDNIKVMIYDTAGHDRFRQITKTQYRGAKGIILVYDVTDKKTFDSVSYWMDHIKENADADVEILLVGNKTDITENRTVKVDDGAELGKKFNVKVVETSAKSGDNVDKAFMSIIDNIYNKEKGKLGTKEEDKSLKNKEKKKSKCCG